MRQRLFRQTAVLASALLGSSVHAIDRIELTIGDLSAPHFSAAGVRAELAIDEDAPVTAAVHASSVEAGETIGALRDVSVTCADLIIRRAGYACPRAAVEARGGITGTLAFSAHADYRSDTETLLFGASRIALAGGRVSLDGRARSGDWALDADLDTLRLSELRKLAARWFELPAGFTLDAGIEGRVRASAGTRAVTVVRMDLTARNLDLTNEAGTVVAEKVAAGLAGNVRLLRDGPTVEARLSSSAGQALAGPVLLDFGAHPLRIDIRARSSGGAIDITAAKLFLQNLFSANGSAEIATRPGPAVRRARVAVEELRFPAAYTSFMQLPLAATDFGALETSGSVSGEIEIADGEVSKLDAKLAKLALEDSRGKFSMHDVNGAMHWSRDGAADVAPSHLGWSRGSAYGLSGGAARLDFLARGLAFELRRPARLPIFDGALLVRSLAVREIGKRETELDFDAVIEPISMPLLSRAFGWPELSGRLSGSIPGLTYRSGVLSMQGDLQAQVFDGTVVGRNFRLQDPLGPWPRLFADITARSLDLELVTRTFSIGTITGRLDADIERLELFNWSPVAFEARLYSTPGDRSRHRISQKAVTAISSIGSGGGGGVTRALQSGVLRFFDDFNYDRVGISCKLRNEICLMSGIERGGIGYYIVKGSGIPRIDIVGSEGRVDWPRLVSQIVAGMRAEEVRVQ